MKIRLPFARHSTAKPYTYFNYVRHSLRPASRVGLEFYARLIATLRLVEAVRVADANPAEDGPPAAAASRRFAEDELVVAAARLAPDGIAVSRLAQGELDVVAAHFAQDGSALEVAVGTSADAEYSGVRLSPVAMRDARAAPYPGAHQAFRAARRRDVLAVQCRVALAVRRRDVLDVQCRVALAVRFQDGPAGRCRGDPVERRDDLADQGGPAERRDGQADRRPGGPAARHREAACRADPAGANSVEVRATQAD